MALVYFLIFFLWAGYRIFFRLPEWFDEFVAKPILWLGPLLYIRKNSLHVGTFERLNEMNVSRNILFGLFVGILYFFTYTLFSYFKFGPPALNPDHLSFGGIILQGAIALCTGCIEEIVFRKYLLEKIILICDDRYIANSISTILFVLIHLPLILFVYMYSLPMTVSYLAVLAISGFIYGAVYLRKRSAISSTFTHAAWNFLGAVIR